MSYIRTKMREMRSDRHARLAVLLASTGLTQADAAELLGVADRSVRRWMEGVSTPPTVAIDRLEALARTLDHLAETAVQAIDEAGSDPAFLLIYRRDEDVPPWSKLPTAGCHLALVRRVTERRPDVQLLIFDR